MKREAVRDMDTTQLTLPISQRDHTLGPSNARITLVEYGDYECPFCGQAHQLVKTILERMGNQLQFAYRHFPLVTVHPHAGHAAEAAESAADQGNFWDMHDLLFENQFALEDEDLAQYARELGLDARRVILDAEVGAHAARIGEDFTSGVRSGVNGTPCFFINGWRYDGARALNPFLEALSQ